MDLVFYPAFIAELPDGSQHYYLTAEKAQAADATQCWPCMVPQDIFDELCSRGVA